MIGDHGRAGQAPLVWSAGWLRDPADSGGVATRPARMRHVQDGSLALLRRVRGGWEATRRRW